MNIETSKATGLGVASHFARCWPIALLVLALLPLSACGFFGSESEASEGGDAPTAASGHRGGPGGRSRGRGGPGGFAPPAGGGGGTSIPIQVVVASVRSISQYLETNGTLEAENDVDLVARTSGPIVELLVEEGMSVEKGQLLARIDAAELSAQLEIARVNEAEAQLTLDRARKSFEAELISHEIYDQARSRVDVARAQTRSSEVHLAYTDVEAPFAGLIVERYIKNAQYVQNGTALFRISDFDPLQCPIQVPEKDLARLEVGQPAYLTVEAYRDDRFAAKVLRVSPIVDSATGTVKVTLEVSTEGKLRPGMFASVYLETDRHEQALVVPKSALVLESIGDTVYLKVGDVARRREVRLGYDEAEVVEVVEGLSAGDEVIVLGQDSLSDGTPVYVLGGTATRAAEPDDAQSDGPHRPGGRGLPDPSQMTPEMLDSIKERMRSRGLSDAEIDQRIEMMKSGQMPRRRPPGS